jgi:hypothetical protein
MDFFFINIDFDVEQNGSKDKKKAKANETIVLGKLDLLEILIVELSMVKLSHDT